MADSWDNWITSIQQKRDTTSMVLDNEASKLVTSNYKESEGENNSFVVITMIYVQINREHRNTWNCTIIY